MKVGHVTFQRLQQGL